MSLANAVADRNLIARADSQDVKQVVRFAMRQADQTRLYTLRRRISDDAPLSRHHVQPADASPDTIQRESRSS